MNNKRRNSLYNAKDLLNRAESIVEKVKDEEQDSFDNMPENLQSSERAEAMEEAIDALEDAIQSIQEAAEYIDNACNGGGN